MSRFALAVALTKAEHAPTLKKLAIKYRAIQKIADDDEDMPLCGNCNGSGEGMHDGSTCSDCGGSGVANRSSREDYEVYLRQQADAYNDTNLLGGLK